MLTDEERSRLLALSRRALEAAADRGEPPAAPMDGALGRDGCCFVTLRGADGALRGCIGGLVASRPLAQEVLAMTRAAALRDPRFPPVEAGEVASLRIGLSVLSPPAPIDARDVVVGRHGLVVSRAGHRGVLLPQVAVEQRWDAETFLDHTCLKAGLPAGAWRDAQTRLEAFEAEVFGE